MNRPFLMARPLPGTVGESARVVHLFPPPDNGEAPEFLTAFCGSTFGPGVLELLDRILGMPCVLCLLVAPASTIELTDRDCAE